MSSTHVGCLVEEEEVPFTLVFKSIYYYYCRSCRSPSRVTTYAIFMAKGAVMSSPSTLPSLSQCIQLDILESATSLQEVHSKDHWTQYEYVVCCWSAFPEKGFMFRTSLGTLFKKRSMAPQTSKYFNDQHQISKIQRVNHIVPITEHI